MLINVLIISVILYILLSYVCVRCSARKAEVCFQKENETDCRLVVLNNSIFPIILLRAELFVKNSITGSENKKDIFCSVFSKGKKEVKCTISEEFCGCVTVSINKVIISDIFGMIKKPLKIKREIKQYILPQIFEFDISKDDMFSYEKESFKYATDKKGDDASEIFDIRSYNEQDTAKKIHWKLSAKTGELLVKEFSFPIESKPLLLVDKKIYDEIFFDESYRAYATEFAISLSTMLIKNEIAHHIAWYDYESKEFEIHKIGKTDDIFEVLFSFLEAPFFREEQISTATEFINRDIRENFSTIFFLSEYDQDLERLTGYGEVRHCRPKSFK